MTFLNNSMNVRSVMNQNSNEIDQYLSFIHPIGSIYKSTSSANPSTLFPNTEWEQIQGKFLFSSDSSHALGSTGGEYEHVLTVDELPIHDHTGGNHTHEVTLTPTVSNSDMSHSHPSELIPGSVSASYLRDTSHIYDTATSRNTSKAVSARFPLTQKDTSPTDHSHTISDQEITTDTFTGNTGSAGDSLAHNNMPPYLSIYMWKRTA